jgi:pimeloyl-ACP methyl ester carboxylesterase
VGERLTEVGYARSGEVFIAYTTIGSGSVDIVLVEGFLTHLSILWEEPGYQRWIHRLAAFARVIRFDKRGMGLSDRVQVGTLEQRMEDVRAVMDAAGSERAVVLGSSEGGPLAMLFAATHPERTSALLLVGAEVKERISPDWPWGEFTQEQFDESLETLATHWGTIGLPPERYAPSVRDAEAVRLLRWSQRLIRESASPNEAIAFKRVGFDIDVRQLCGSVRVPTLILHRTGDRVCHVENARFLARTLPDATYRELPGDDHVPWMNPASAEEIATEIQEYLTGTRENAQPDRVLTTVLFTDIVESTSTMVRVGDARWRGLLQLHHATIRRQLERFRGREVDTAGDGFFATFDGPARAIRCAHAIDEAVAELGLLVRAGVHTGEVEVIGSQLGGITVHIGARVAAEAGPGELLATSTVRDLVAGSGITFVDRGDFRLKGIPGVWRLMAVPR